jgi:uncharacterized protein YecE (DUF72 family)
MMASDYSLGLPFWGFEDWAGTLYSADVRPGERLAQYTLLQGASLRCAKFLDRMGPMGERLGRFMIQLPAAFGPEHLDRLARLLGPLMREVRS